MEFKGSIKTNKDDLDSNSLCLLLWPLLQSTCSTCSGPVLPSLHPWRPPSTCRSRSGIKIFKRVTFQPSCGCLRSCVLCCVWVWGPRIAHTPPAIHWPRAALFHVREAGVKGKRRRCWPIPSLSFTLLAISVSKGHNRERRRQ